MTATKERPIIFSAPMIKALLAGTKTQTRRLYKERLGYAITEDRRDFATWTRIPWPTMSAFRGWEPSPWLSSPLGEPGDRLWVRETHALAPVVEDPCDPSDAPDDWSVVYRADGDERPWMSSLDEDAFEIPAPWRSPIYMHRWASRITLEVATVRFQRLHDISEEDAMAEGVTAAIMAHETFGGRFSVAAYAELWDSINGERAPWASNPWVWAVSFKVVTP